jgi:hypothetical protein
VLNRNPFEDKQIGILLCLLFGEAVIPEWNAARLDALVLG